MSKPVSRRRVIRIAAASAGAAVSARLARITHAAGYAVPMVWRGAALGAKAEIRLYHDNPDRAKAILDTCRREINRLEGLFSLYREGSEIRRLNRDGILAEPSIELVELLSRVKSFSALTRGAFDVTVQPLWELYATHFEQAGANPAGPPDAEIAAALDLVGSANISIATTHIALSKQGMGITLNGVAQGYITEKITDRLRRGGFDNLLVHLGETQALGGHPDGRPWTVGIPVPPNAEGTMTTVPLVDQALATSGGYGSPLSDDGKIHHLLDPRTGRSANIHQSVSVLAPGATNADMLSTAIAIMPRDDATALLARFPDTSAIIFSNAGDIVRL